MVRIAGLERMVQEGITLTSSPDPLSPEETLHKVRDRVKELTARSSKVWRSLRKELELKNITLLKWEDLAKNEKLELNAYFEEQIAPVLTPLSIDPAHPFPYLANLRPYLVAEFDMSAESQSAETPIVSMVELPSVLPRFVIIQQSPTEARCIMAEEIIGGCLDKILFGFPVKAIHMVRVARNFDYNLLENEVVDLLKSVQNEVRRRSDQECVKLEVSKDFPQPILELFQESLEIGSEQTHEIDGPIDLSKVKELLKLSRPDLKNPSFNPRIPPRLVAGGDIFSVIADGDLLVHHPYDSFYAVTRFLYAAATDPDVLAIKQTLYRTSGDSPIIEALLTAAENGKQVVAVIELKARFDEKANIVWARRLERAGVNVVFGFVGYKTHAKSCLVVRREKGRLVRYAHLSTGNYNSTTALHYTDIGILTCNPKMTADIAFVFNFLTGYNILAGENKLVRSRLNYEFAAISMAPFDIRSTIIASIEKEISNCKKGKGCRIILKMNALVDSAVIDKLYEASNAGVKITLLIRGICCLVPKVKGLSSNIEVLSTVDRFLEHSRILYFYNDGKHAIFLSSADCMPRNFDRRIEVMFPIKDEQVRKQIIDEIIPLSCADNQNSWQLNTDGTYERKLPATGDTPIRSQQRFIEIARQGGVKSMPYEKAIRYKKRGEAPIARTRKRSSKKKK